MTHTQTRKLTTSAMMLALATAIAFICGLIPFLNFPFGGGFTIASMLPLVIISYMYGVKWGLLSGFAYSILQMFLGHSTISALFLPSSDSYMGIGKAVLICLIDYILAYTVLGLGGVFRNKLPKVPAIVLGVVLALGLRYLVHIVSGYFFFGMWAEWFFGEEGFALGNWILTKFSGWLLSLLYSIVYNGLYMIPEIVITAVCASGISFIPYIKKYDLKA